MTHGTGDIGRKVIRDTVLCEAWLVQITNYSRDLVVFHPNTRCRHELLMGLTVSTVGLTKLVVPVSILAFWKIKSFDAFAILHHIANIFF